MSIQDENRTNRGYVETVMEHNLLGLLQGSIAREARPRFLLGVTGPPAAGKSTFAALLAAALNEKMGEGFAVVVPMDRFHLPNEELKERGLGALKGVPQTFDAQGFVDTFERKTCKFSGNRLGAHCTIGNCMIVLKALFQLAHRHVSFLRREFSPAQ